MRSQLKEIDLNQTMLSEVLEGLQKSQKTLPSKYFYDKRGSELFEHICELEEYYPTRTELSIMRNYINEMVEQLGEHVQLVELGSGSSLKTRLLLGHLPNQHSYIPVDISEEFLAKSAGKLQDEYPELNIKPVAADYTQDFELPGVNDGINRVVYFPGSTIGNFTKERASEFLGLIADQIGPKGGLLIGFDLLKDRETLINAYDDKMGVTAAFNKNILRRINRELDGDFDLESFEHRAVFNDDKSRIEMHLVSEKDQTVPISHTSINFSKGETIHTENSHKYTLDSFRDITGAYFKPVKTWMDEKDFFAVQLLKPA